MIIWVILLLFMVMFVVVRLELIVVIFWYVEIIWLCGGGVWPSGVVLW